MVGVGGAAVPGSLSLAGTEARPTDLLSYKVIRVLDWSQADEEIFMAKEHLLVLEDEEDIPELAPDIFGIRP